MSETAFPAMLRDWRRRARFSQLDLALEAGLSQRHLSFLETGRARPGAELVRRLGAALGMPAAELAALTRAAGYAPPGGANWGAETRAALDAAVGHVLDGHAPYPAVAMDWMWTVSRANAPALAFFSRLGLGAERNLLRAVLAPGPLRERMENWEETAAALLRLIALEIARRPNDPAGRALLEELRSLAGKAVLEGTAQSARPAPVMSLTIRLGEARLSLLSMIATIGMSHDAMIDDLRIETLLPADAQTRAWFEAL
ncbi:transcriptional regulator [Maritimibacter sp. 55A14]|uniref:helix-turn-helix domain-containing protein n=1 Tax=Maritimibacter sp. 55A14 TaxID=2174844 RepID=UPI000D60F663|nr:helix-turn-helix transcriptional regulator [Maritimibacter sp. 55A14]PWE32339.1 transcriptional regulator [Maritimibacter sp. 55A14]